MFDLSGEARELCRDEIVRTRSGDRVRYAQAPAGTIDAAPRAGALAL